MQTRTATTQTDTEALLTAAHNAHAKRLLKAVKEFAGYRLLADGDLLNLETGDVYHQVGKSGCTCPDFGTRIQPLRDRMTEAGIATPCCCKHHAIRRLLSGQTVRVGNSVFRAKKK